MNKTSENRRITLKVISYILVLAIALQFIVIHVSASDNISYICTSRVTLPPIRDKDWTNAEETLKPGNKLYWGCFHNQVRDYIAAKYGLETEMEIIYQDGRTGTHLLPYRRLDRRFQNEISEEFYNAETVDEFLSMFEKINSIDCSPNFFQKLSVKSTDELK